MRYALLAGVGSVALGFAVPANAGKMVLTGHDNDFHCSGGSGSTACATTGAELSYVRAGSILPVLAIDDGLGGHSGGFELNATLTSLGVPFTSVKPSAVTASMFNHATYSAVVVASVTSCGGCDNPIGTGTGLHSFATQIASFFNNGGGILGLTAATDPAGFAYVPDAAGTPSPITSISGFTATANGTTDIPGFTAVNGDETHNVFAEPGTGGVDPAYLVAERWTTGTGAANQPVTLYLNGTITCTGTHCSVHGAPEPMTLSLLGAGLFGLGAARRRWRK